MKLPWMKQRPDFYTDSGQIFLQETMKAPNQWTHLSFPPSSFWTQSCTDHFLLPSMLLSKNSEKEIHSQTKSLQNCSMHEDSSPIPCVGKYNKKKLHREVFLKTKENGKNAPGNLPYTVISANPTQDYGKPTYLKIKGATLVRRKHMNSRWTSDFIKKKCGIIVLWRKKAGKRKVSFRMGSSGWLLLFQVSFICQ